MSDPSLSPHAGTALHLRFHERHALKTLAEDLLRVDAEVRGENLLIHRPEVDRVREVSELVELREVGRLAVETALDAVADEEDRRGRAMVGSAARVLLGTAAEL